ncbi:MAG: hypothetical protein V1810_00065 [Candidatus Beckwithbacteria bacterium]
MAIKIFWRSTIFIITLTLIYLAFPVLIVPSSLPAIQAMFIDNEYPQNYQAPASLVSYQNPDLEIYELKLPNGPSFNQKIQLIKDLHQQGLDLILNRASL